MAAAGNPWLERRVLAYAHQGGEREAPSNTLYAIEHALATGADAIELDVHSTRDGELVICHDATLERTTNGSGPIAEHTLAEIEQLDAAYHFIPGVGAHPGSPEDAYPLRGRRREDARLGVATLASVLEATRGALLNLDVKQTAPVVRAYEERLVAMLREHGRTDDVIVGSFHEAATDRVKAIAPEIAISPQRRGILAFLLAVRTRTRPPDWLRRYAALQVPTHVRKMRLVNRRFVEAAHRIGVAVHVWTVNGEAEMERLLEDGVDGIMTDVPSVLERVLRDTASPRWRRDQGPTELG